MTVQRSRSLILPTLILAIALASGSVAASELGTIEMQAQLTLPYAGNITDVWGYVDPVSGKEYALVGNRAFMTSGVHLIDVSNPLNPTVKRHITSTSFGFNSFDVKTYGPYAYCVSGSNSGFGRAIDLTNIEFPVVGGSFPNSHNLAVDPRGYLVMLRNEVRIYDLTVNPTTPPLIWEDNITGTHDASVVGNRLYDFHGPKGTRVYDITTVTAPVELGRINAPVDFHHSGYPTKDEKYLFITNELANHPTPDITVWNIEDLTSPFQVASIAESLATVHNLYIVGDYAYVSYYTLGFHVYDVSDPTNPRLADSFDTSPLSGEGFEGAFGVYPFTPSGAIYVSDIDQGLFVFSFTPPTTSAVLFQQFDAAIVNGVVTLTWALSEADGLSGFHVYRSDVRDGEFARITNEMLLPGDAYIYRDESAESGRTYYYRLGAVDNDGEFASPVKRVDTPASPLGLSQNFPNPFNPVTTIAFDLKNADHIRLSVYDARGAKIRTLAEGPYEAGPHSVVWDATDENRARVASGTYFYRLEAGGLLLTRRMVLLK